MEKKTIGKFIAALRKANGMTQRDLADKLHVSDKTVSRWERDEGTPDLSMIPVLAEIFEVSCDELLVGERRRLSEMNETIFSPKGKLQRQRLLKNSLSHYQNATWIALGISGVGVIVALIANLAFLKAVLGFLFGMVFYVISAVCQLIFMNRAFLSVEDAQLDESECASFKNKVMVTGQKSIGVTIACTGFTFPLLMMDAYVGLAADDLLVLGLIGTGVFLMGYAVILYFLNDALIQQRKLMLSASEMEAYTFNHRLQKRCVLFFLAILSCTLFMNALLTTIWGPHSIMDGITFTDYDSFVAFMEQDIPAHPYDAINGIDVEELIDSTIYYDEQGNVISEKEYLHREITDADGNVVCEYIARNESVVSIIYSPKSGTVLPITVHTEEHLSEAREKAETRQVIFCFVYGLEILAVLAVYLKKRKKSM